MTKRGPVSSLPIKTLRASVLDRAGGPVGDPVEGEVIGVGSAEANALVVADPLVSRFHVELRASPQGIRVRDLGSTNGTFLGGARLLDAVVPPGSSLAIGAHRILVDDGALGSAEVAPGHRLGGLWGASAPARRLMEQVERAAKSQASIHVVGESGTGKEIVARTLHEASDRSGGPFEIVDCGTLLPALVASELFGHERGAFTGADRAHVGAFERAQGGTLFIDEVGELPLSVQPALLGALERRRVRRLGSKSDVPVDVRVISATHRDLRSEVNAGSFRLDLYYRLAVVTLTVPPLRERREDVRLLAEHFLREAGEARPLSALLSPQVIEQLEARSFPGNVRELRNVVEALLAMGELPPADATLERPPSADVIEASLELPYKQARERVLHAFESSYLPALMRRTDGNVARASREASMDRSHLTDLLRRHRIK